MSEKEKILAELERLEKKNNCGTAEFIEAKRIAYGEVRKAVNSLKGKTRAELFDEYLKASPKKRREFNMDFLGGPVERLMRSTAKLHDDIDDCISQIVKSRLDKDIEAEGRAMFRMESLMVGTQQQLGCILDLFKEKPKKKTNALFEKCVAAVDPEIKQKVSDAVDKSNWESDLKKEIDRFWEKDFDGNCANYFEAMKQTARHFAEWQKERKAEWNIEKAKPGDIVHTGSTASSETFIFKEITSDGNVECFCSYDSEDGFCEGEYHYIGQKYNKYTLATPEQCISLGRSMGRAGYIWDAKQLKLKKLNITKR